MISPTTSFFLWLSLQSSHPNKEIRRLAVEVSRDKTFPRNMRKLHLFLSYYDLEPNNREAIKMAHSEWRRLRGSV